MHFRRHATYPTAPHDRKPRKVVSHAVTRVENPPSFSKISLNACNGDVYFSGFVCSFVFTTSTGVMTKCAAEQHSPPAAMNRKYVSDVSVCAKNTV